MSDRPVILVVDDEPQIVRAVQVVLRNNGFDAVPAGSLQEALDQAALRPPAGAIIDLLLPDGDGIELCGRLREWTNAPIILLSAVGDEDEKVRALEAGADDYVVKPFAPRELVARMRAALRRTATQDSAGSAIVRAEGLEVDLGERQVRVGGELVHLTPTEFGLLRTLLGHRGRLLTHDHLLVEVWGPSYAGETGVLRSHMANLRRKLGPAAQAIETEMGVGYRFVG
ncbi:MAG TPA: response regulator transcription factor [Solirubrobacteraceae bacterium]|jgi:two-component system KDP operon response regulator KdpE|nr:response regulator transcription factor [Solirubrobacteraceae bacterium]